MIFCLHNGSCQARGSVATVTSALYSCVAATVPGLQGPYPTPSASVMPDGQNAATDLVVGLQPFWVFPRMSFSGRQRWRDELKDIQSSYPMRIEL